MEINDQDLISLTSMVEDIATIQDSKTLFLKIFRNLNVLYNAHIMGLGLFSRDKKEIGFIVVEWKNDVSLDELSVWLDKVPVDRLNSLFKRSDSEIFVIDSNDFPILKNLKNEQPLFDSVIKKLKISIFDLVPMQSGGEELGYLLFAKDEDKKSEQNVTLSIMISNLVGSVFKQTWAYRKIQEREKEKEVQIKFFSDLVELKDKEKLYVKLSELIDSLIYCDYLTVLIEKDMITFPTTFSVIKNTDNKFSILPQSRISLPTSIFNKIDYVGSNKLNFRVISGEVLNKLCNEFTQLRIIKDKHNIKSLLVLSYSSENVGTMNLVIGRKKQFEELNSLDRVEFLFANLIDPFFTLKDIELGLDMLPNIGLILSNFYGYEEIKILTNKLEQEKSYLVEEINITNSFQEIIGNSTKIQVTLNKIKQVAPLDVTVLIQGETGTGKELVAKAVHNLSSRKENAFITVNCAALPSQLIESELFGHERGSFTGAVDKRIGKFEVANKGTIFLDEIGELPLELQSKLLRVLQEKEFERLGGKNTIYSDVRIVAATNRDLEKEVSKGKFRSDLFFRLNVFPIIVPPLRERNEDIPLLIKYFINKMSKKIGQTEKAISKKDLNVLQNYTWPGNVRELEHLIERSLILSDGPILNFENVFTGFVPKEIYDPETFKTLIELEKEHIIEALKISKGKITGENSAAQFLGINGKTLGSKMKKLNIKRQFIITSDKN